MTKCTGLFQGPVRIAIASILLFSSPCVIADIDIATEDLKDCVSRHLDKEKEKSNPKANNLLNICKKELDALVDLLPLGTDGDVELLILSDIEDQLAEA